MANTNPPNFANLPKDELREIAAKGGHASHGGQVAEPQQQGRRSDGTFLPGSQLAKDLGSIGGHVAHEHAIENEGRNPDGTFKAGTALAKELGEKGGHASHDNA
ncbi:uncharacterized protein BDR25DRAFT_293139 [Lindgomyces ingoldianus]|uniref:Uncharacterized protein n=1 Tax=Lindgomyces ingoldianus TaxID=673940 RepID=A0ACB6QKS6_9PLEO|nr:uncharacterized protein BDR25DRAFT_293139 [Lindgomyces ingoldianus]KAF2466746.1 hypothetical protein BDR25DRAFT_293139 [Lindgomyces ingoldianus]